MKYKDKIMPKTSQKREKEYWDSLQKQGAEANLKYSRDLPNDTPEYALKMLTQFEIDISGYAFDNCSGLFLDAGCGTGNMYLHALQLFPEMRIEYIGLDMSENMLKRAIAQTEGKGSPHFLKGTVTNLPFGSDCFDRILASGVITYLGSLNEVEEAMREFHRMLKPDGVLIIDFFNQASHTAVLKRLIRRRRTIPPKDIFPLWFLRALKRAGFTIVDYRGYDFKPIQGRSFMSRVALVRLVGKPMEHYTRFIEKKIVPHIPIISLLGQRISVKCVK